jgi:hypothetical protein
MHKLGEIAVVTAPITVIEFEIEMVPTPPTWYQQAGIEVLPSKFSVKSVTLVQIVEKFTGSDQAPKFPLPQLERTQTLYELAGVRP